MFRAAMDVIAGMADTVNKLMEVDSSLNVSVADWPNSDNADPWSDPFKPG